MTRLGSIAVAIPAFQAALSVPEVVRRTTEQIDDILVVDDGSTDGTADAAREAGARVIRHERNLGKGRALRTAFGDLLDRGHDAVITLDADGQHLPEQIPVLISAARGGADLVIGGRAHLFHELHWVRRASNRISSTLISAAAGQWLSDIQSGFRLYARPLIETAGFPEPRFDAESAVVVRAVRFGFRVVNVPVRLGFADGRTTSHYRPLIDSLRIFAAVTRARLECVGWPLEHTW